MSYFHYIEVLFHFLLDYCNNHCGKKTNLHIYYTPYTKEFPLHKNHVLDVSNINSGFSDVCASVSNVTIFRKEEWFKVCIHELLHNFGADKSLIELQGLKNVVKDLYPIKSTMQLNESYVETWAIIINCLFWSNYANNNLNLRQKNAQFKKFILTEQIFSLFQCVKILKFMGITYKNLHQKSTTSYNLRKIAYKEKTNVFAYYIIKLLFLHDYFSFLTFCNTNNTQLIECESSPQLLESYFGLIKSLYDTKDLRHHLKIIENALNNVKNTSFKKTLRMSLFDLL
jgi:hypothetical protein